MNEKLPELDTPTIGNMVLGGVKALGSEPSYGKTRRKTANDTRAAVKKKQKRRKRNKTARRSRRINRLKKASIVAIIAIFSACSPQHAHVMPPADPTAPPPEPVVMPGHECEWQAWNSTSKPFCGTCRKPQNQIIDDER